MRPRRSWLDIADAAMLAVVVIWTANTVFVKAVLDEVSPMEYVVARFAIVVLLLFAWLAWRHQLHLPARTDWPLIGLSGLSGYAIYQALFTVGLRHTSAFSVSLLLSLGPVLTMLFAVALGMEHVRARQWLGALIATAGVVLFVGESIWRSPAGWRGSTASGDLLSLLAATAFAVYSLTARPLVMRYGATVATAWSSLAGLLMVMPIGWEATRDQRWTGLSLDAWASLAFASVVSMLIAYTIWSWAIERRGVSRTVPYLFLVPIATGVLAAWLLGERFGLPKIAGALLVLFGTALVRLANRTTVVRAEARPVVAPESTRVN